LTAPAGPTTLSGMGDAFVVPPDGGRTLDLGNFEAVVLATGDQTDGAFSLLRTQHEPTGFGPPLHRHHDSAEAFYVLDGEYLMILEDRREACPAGSFVYVPRGVAHTFQVTSAAPGTKLNLFAPAGMVGFFEALAEAEAAGTATPELLDRIAAEHHMEIVGPVPDSYL
jgi:mannose-6-phosphate isomerase-like protein (cupin superfamily)